MGRPHPTMTHSDSVLRSRTGTANGTAKYDMLWYCMIFYDIKFHHYFIYIYIYINMYIYIYTHVYIYISPRYVRRRRVPWLSMVDGMVGCHSPAAKQKRCHAAAMRLAEPCIPRMATGVCVGSDSTDLVPENGIELPCPLTTANEMPIFRMILSTSQKLQGTLILKGKTPVSPIAHILLRHTRCHYLVSRLLLMIKCRCVLHVQTYCLKSFHKETLSCIHNATLEMEIFQH